MDIVEYYLYSQQEQTEKRWRETSSSRFWENKINWITSRASPRYHQYTFHCCMLFIFNTDRYSSSRKCDQKGNGRGGRCSEIFSNQVSRKSRLPQQSSETASAEGLRIPQKPSSTTHACSCYSIVKGYRELSQSTRTFSEPRRHSNLDS